jgi:hypothetical protein
MSTNSEGPGEDDGSMFDDPWVNDVTKMGIGWFIGTVVAILLLLYVLPGIL